MARNWHPYIIAHRGASGIAPENTLPAFHAAANLDVPRIELDVQLSADYYPVIFHSARVDEQTDGTGRVDELSLAELKALDAAVRSAPNFPNTQIPTLDDVFDTFTDTFHYHIALTVDDNTDVERLVRAVVSCVRAHRVERVVLTSHSNAALQFTARCCPDMPRGKIVGEGDPRVDSAIEDAHMFGCTTVCLHRAHLSERTVEYARRHGLFIVGWPANTPEEFDEMRSARVDALSTDRPDVAIEWMGEKGITPHP